MNFSLNLRIPGWLERTPAINVNGVPTNAEVRRGFAILRRHWKAGDTVTLEFAQSFRAEAIDELHPNTVAIMRGPLMYVEVNPGAESSKLAPLDGLRPVDEGRERFWQAMRASSTFTRRSTKCAKKVTPLISRRANGFQ